MRDENMAYPDMVYTVAVGSGVLYSFMLSPPAALAIGMLIAFGMVIWNDQ